MNHGKVLNHVMFMLKTSFEKIDIPFKKKKKNITVNNINKSFDVGFSPFKN